MRIQVLSVLLFGVVFMTWGQDLTVFNLDYSQYPVVKANFLATDVSGEQVLTVSKGNAKILENEIEQEVIKVVNPTYPEGNKKNHSIVLTVDVSGSMEGEAIERLQGVLESFVDQLRMDRSEVAVTSFDHLNYVNQSFSHDKAQLKNTISTLHTHGFTDYEKAFNTPLTGAIDISSKGAFQKSIVFLTDGLGELDVAKTLARLKSKKVKVYCISIGFEIPESLKTLAQETGGYAFTHMGHEQQLADYFKILVKDVQGVKPSYIEWKSKASCVNVKNAMFESTALKGAKHEWSYRMQGKDAVGFDVGNTSITLSGVDPNKAHKFELKLGARNAPFEILGIKSTNPAFTVLRSPTILEANKLTSIPVEYQPETGKHDKTIIEVVTKECGSIRFRVENGMSEGDFIPLELITPNGGEKYLTQYDTLIEWGGVPADLPVIVSFSEDQGNSWDTLTETGSNGVFNWQTSERGTNKALVKVSVDKKLESGAFELVGDSISGLVEYEPHYWPFPNKDVVASSIGPHRVALFHAQTKEQLRVRQFRYGIGISSVSKNGDFIYACHFIPGAYMLYKLDATSLVTLDSLPVANFQAQNGYYRTSSKTRVEYFEFEGYKKIGEIPVKFESADVVAKGNVAIHIENVSILNIWNLRQAKKLHSIKLKDPMRRATRISDDERFVIVSRIEGRFASFKEKRKRWLDVYDVATGQLKVSMEGLDVGGMNLSTSGNYMAFKHNGQIVVVDIESGDIKYEIPFGPEVRYDHELRSLKLSNDGLRLEVIAGGGPKTEQNRHVYQFEEGESKVKTFEDQSDAVFTIWKPELSLKDYDFGKVSVESKPSLVKVHPFSSTEANLSVLGVEIVGLDSSAFRVIRVPKTIDGKGMSMEIEFSPKKEGAFQASARIKTEAGVYTCSLTGIGEKVKWQALAPNIDLGEFNLGSQHDTVVVSQIRNQSESKLSGLTCKLLDNGQKQFHSVNAPKGIKKLASGDFGISFSALDPGLITGLVACSTPDLEDDLLFTVTAKVNAFTTFTYEVKVKERVTRQEVDATVKYVDSEYPEDTIFAKSGDELTLFTGRQYAFVVLPENDSKSTWSLLKKPSLIEAYDTTLYIQGVPNEDDLELFGLITDRAGNVLKGVGMKVDQNEQLDEFQNNDDGTYARFIRDEGNLKVVADLEGYLPAVYENDDLSTVVGSRLEVNLTLTKIVEGEATLLENVLFVRSKAILIEESFAPLDMLMLYLQEHPLAHVELAGHTDNMGNPKLNQQLSEDRVIAIQDYLVEKGIDKKRISGKGYGGENPIASNSQEKTRKLNRRVEFVIQNR